MIGEYFFLIALALIWIVVAVVQDFRKREVANWLNFSLIAVALAYRAFLSVWLRDPRYFIYGVVGFGIFFVLAHIFYYGRVFAGGDAKLLMGLGAVLPFYAAVWQNVVIFMYFILGILLFGGVYGLVYSGILAVKNKKRFFVEFEKHFKKNKWMVDSFVVFAVVLAGIILLFFDYIFMAFPMLILVFPFLYVYAKAIEEGCMIKRVKAGNLVVGDWLYEPIKIGKKKILPSWHGLTEQELKIVKKYKGEILVKDGIPFTPGFLFAFAFVIWLVW